MFQRGSRSGIKNIEGNAVDPESPEGEGEFQSLLRGFSQTNDTAAADGKSLFFQNLNGVNAIPEGVGRTYLGEMTL